MKPKLINIDLSEITKKLELIQGEMSEDIISKLKEASIFLPDFDTFEREMVQVPIIEQPEVLVNNSVYPSLNTFFTKVITFRKNHKSKTWVFYSKNF